jgi:hypothetical protein
MTPEVTFSSLIDLDGLLVRLGGRTARRLFVLLVWILAAPGLAAQDAASEGSASEPTSPALARAREAAAHLESLPAFQFDATIVFDVVRESGQKLQFSDRRVLTIRRPDRAHAAYTDDKGGVHYLYYDGDTLTRYDRSANAYGALDVPDTLDETLDYLEFDLGAPVPLGDLLYSDVSHLGTAARAAEVVGVSYVAGVYCDHLAFRNDALDWQVWIERGEAPWLRKLVITYKDAPGQPQFAAYFTRWDAAPAAGDDRFEFRPPDHAERISTIALPARGRAEETKIQGEGR